MKRTLPESEKGVSFRTGRYLVATQDVILAVAASLLSILLIRWLSEPIPGFSQLVWRWLGISLAGVLSGGLVSRIWRQRFSHFGILGLGRLLSTLFIKETMLVVTLLTGWIHCPTLELSFLAIATDLLLSASFLLIPRYIFSTLRSEERAVARSLGRKTALVAGTGEPALTMAAEAEASGRYNVVGFLTTDQKEEGHLLDGRVVYFCEDADDLNTLQWRLGGIDTLLFPTDWGTHSKRTHQASSGMEGQPDHSPMSLLGYAFKRCFDVVLSALLLIVFSPLIGLCALAICIEDGKPVIYRQERIGKNGKPASSASTTWTSSRSSGTCCGATCPSSAIARNGNIISTRSWSVTRAIATYTRSAPASRAMLPYITGTRTRSRRCSPGWTWTCII